jgi:hypothetical protein
MQKQMMVSSPTGTGGRRDGGKREEGGRNEREMVPHPE